MGTQHVHRVIVKKNTFTEDTCNKDTSCTTAVKWHVGTQYAQTICMSVSVIIDSVIMFCHMCSKGV